MKHAGENICSFLVHLQASLGSGPMNNVGHLFEVIVGLIVVFSVCVAIDCVQFLNQLDCCFHCVCSH